MGALCLMAGPSAFVENRESMAAGPDSLSRLGGLCADACPRSESANCEDSKPSYTIELKFPGRCEIVVTRPVPWWIMFSMSIRMRRDRWRPTAIRVTSTLSGFGTTRARLSLKGNNARSLTGRLCMCTSTRLARIRPARPTLLPSATNVEAVRADSVCSLGDGSTASRHARREQHGHRHINQSVFAPRQDSGVYLRGRQVPQLRLCMARPLELGDGDLHGGRQLRCIWGPIPRRISGSGRRRDCGGEIDLSEAVGRDRRFRVTLAHCRPAAKLTCKLRRNGGVGATNRAAGSQSSGSSRSAGASCEG